MHMSDLETYEKEFDGSKQPTSASDQSNINRNKVFVGGLSIRVTDEILFSYFSSFGELEKLSIIKKNGISRGFGFLNFKTYKAAKLAVDTTHYLEGKYFNCKFVLAEEEAKEQMLSEKERKLFVKGLPLNARIQQLEEYFGQFGRVERSVINKYYNETSKGTGFVLFTSSAAVRFLLESPHLKHMIGSKEVKVYECLTKKEIEDYGGQKAVAKAQQNAKNSSAAACDPFNTESRNRDSQTAAARNQQAKSQAKDKANKKRKENSPTSKNSTDSSAHNSLQNNNLTLISNPRVFPQDFLPQAKQASGSFLQRAAAKSVFQASKYSSASNPHNSKQSPVSTEETTQLSQCVCCMQSPASRHASDWYLSKRSGVCHSCAINDMERQRNTLDPSNIRMRRNPQKPIYRGFAGASV